MRIAAFILAVVLTGCTGPPPFVVDRLDERIARGGVLRVRCDLPIAHCRPSAGMPATLPHAAWPTPLFPEEE